MKHFCFLISTMLLLSLTQAAELKWPGQVMTVSGALRGDTASQEITIFRGIPYAAPPVGTRRWKPPEPPAPWEGIRPAVTFGASCPQPASTFEPPYTAEFAATTPTNEDCLFLNVWTPAKTAKDQLAVMVYVHGGSGTRGSGSIDIYDGSALARKGIIVITINFRLGILGGFGHPGLTAESAQKACGNYGMQDIIAALKWVQGNIAAFGGDPQKVTLCGQSSGSMAVHYLTSSPLAKGLFRSVIAVSFPYDFLTKQHAVGNVWQKEQHGLKFAAAKKADSLSALRGLSVADLLAADSAVEPFTRAVMESGLNTDGWMFPVDYPKALDTGSVADLPVLTSITQDDFGPPENQLKTTVASFSKDLAAVFGTRKAVFGVVEDRYVKLCAVTTDEEARRAVKRAQMEYRLAGIWHWAKRRNQHAASPVYAYLFDQPIPWPQHPKFGAFHSSDLVYSFDNLAKLNRPWTDEDRRVADMISTVWVNFVKTGAPSATSLPGWEPTTNDSPKVMTIGPRPAVRSIADEERMALYRELLEAKL